MYILSYAIHPITKVTGVLALFINPYSPFFVLLMINPDDSYHVINSSMFYGSGVAERANIHFGFLMADSLCYGVESKIQLI